MNKHIWILVLAVIIIIAGGFIFWCTSTTSSTSNNNFVNDDSDVPLPPSTLEYNKSLAPPKRNHNIMNASSKINIKKYDSINKYYYTLSDNIPL